MSMCGRFFIKIYFKIKNKKTLYKKKLACNIIFVAEINRSETIERWGISSAGRAPALHAGGQEFESPILHHKKDNDICFCPFYFVWVGFENYKTHDKLCFNSVSLCYSELVSESDQLSVYTIYWKDPEINSG